MPLDGGLIGRRSYIRKHSGDARPRTVTGPYSTGQNSAVQYGAVQCSTSGLSSIPCYAMLCYAMLCYAMLCFAMLCHPPFSSLLPLVTYSPYGRLRGHSNNRGSHCSGPGKGRVEARVPLSHSAANLKSPSPSPSKPKPKLPDAFN
jgi:hypothetical protein